MNADGLHIFELFERETMSEEECNHVVSTTTSL